jgi:hypothetical protein
MLLSARTDCWLATSDGSEEDEDETGLNADNWDCSVALTVWIVVAHRTCELRAAWGPFDCGLLSSAHWITLAYVLCGLLVRRSELRKRVRLLPEPSSPR